MKAIAATLCALALLQGGPSIVDHPRQLRTPPLRPFVPPELTRLKLESGAQLLVIENKELPLVDGVLIFRGGVAQESRAQAGLTELLAEVLREGGSERTSGLDLDDWLDTHAASIDVRSEPDSLRIEFSCVKDDLGTVLVFIGELLLLPAYPAEELEFSRTRMLSRLARAAQDPALLADRSLAQITAGTGGANAHQPTEESVRSIERADLLLHHRRLLGTDRLLVGATGAVNPSSLAARFDSLLSTVPNVGPLPSPSTKVFRVPGRRTIYVLDRPGMERCEIRLAAPGTRRLDSDYVPLSLWSYANGYGGTSNRLMVRLRSELGLAFEGSLYFQPEWDRSGRLFGACSARVDKVGQVLSTCIELLQAARDPLPAPELEAVRQRMLNAEVFQIDSAQEVLERALKLEFHGYPSEFWTRRDARLRQLSAEQVALAVKRHLDPSRLVVVVVGPAEKLAEALAPLGTLVRL